MIIGLLHERDLGATSRFATYLWTLPAEPPATLATWGERIRRAVEPLHEAELMHQQLLEGLPGFLAQVGGGLAWSEEDMRWAIAIVQSRSFGKAGEQNLVPLFDMANHDGHPSFGNAKLACDGVPDGRRGCTITARAAVTAGEEVTVNYGNKSNLSLLSAYGFDLGAQNPYSAAGQPLGLALRGLTFEDVSGASEESVWAKCQELAEKLGGSLTSGHGRKLAQDAAVAVRPSIQARVVAALRHELEIVEQCARGGSRSRRT